MKPEETTASIGKEEAPKAKVETEEESISDPQRLYQKAFGRLKSEDYSEAILTFKRFVQKFPDHDYTDNALYWLGEIYYSQKNFPHAIIEFKRVVEEYPNGNKVPDALLKIGLSYVNLKDVRNAEDYLQRVMDIYPFSEAAEKASISLKKLEK
ncbi:MAG: tol-pal system protein YbgF [Pseudomonadota bacterium]